MPVRMVEEASSSVGKVFLFDVRIGDNSGWFRTIRGRAKSAGWTPMSLRIADDAMQDMPPEPGPFRSGSGSAPQNGFRLVPRSRPMETTAKKPASKPLVGLPGRVAEGG